MQSIAASLNAIESVAVENTKKASADSPSFEGALTEIDRIVAEIEGGDLPLEQIVANFKRASQLIRDSAKLLTEVEQQIKKIEPELLKANSAKF